MIVMGEKFDKAKAEKYVIDSGIQNVTVQAKPNEPEELPNGSIMFSGIVGYDITLESIKPYLNKGVDIVTDSIGGSLFEAYRIKDYIKTIAPETVIGVVGYCASAATIILLGAKKENRWSSENSRFLIHYPTNKSVGDASTLLADAIELKKEEDEIVSMYSVEFGLPTEEIRSIMSPEKIMNPKEALLLGLIGEIKGGSVDPLPVDKPKIENVEMTEAQVNGFMDKIADGFAKVMNLIKPKAIVLQDVNGVELDFGPDVISEEQVVVGVTGVTANGEQANDTYTFASGKVVVIEAGTVTAVTIPEEETDAVVEQLQTENALLKQEIVNLKAENSTLAKANSDVNAAATKAFNDFTAFKNQFSKGGSGSAAVPPEEAQATEKKKFTYNGKKK